MTKPTDDGPTELSEFPFSTEYRSGEHDPGREFFSPALQRSVRYDRAVGYFRSSVFLVVGAAFLDFARAGGRVRFVCSPEMSREDLEALAVGHAQRDTLIASRMEEAVDQILAQIDLRSPTEFLATLVAAGALEMRIAVRPAGHGIYHEKIGLFEDARGNVLSFKGSSNETWHGWHERGNLESIEVFCSWVGGTDAARVERHRRYFDRLWQGEVPQVNVLPFPEAARLKLCSVAHPSIEEAVGTLGPAIAPSSPTATRVPLPHQAATIASWRESGCRGIAKHATGSGKTYTALMATREHVHAGRPALILVPSKLLLEQWAVEVREAIPSAIVLLAGGGHSGWRKQGRLEAHTRRNRDLGARIVISTMQTGVKQEFRKRVEHGDDLLLVVDEVHQLGSTRNAEAMEIDAGSRLGLSATPERYGDPAGTARLLEYFGGILKPEISLADAIAAGRLVEYVYFPHALHLTEDEAADWTRVTERIRLEVARTQSDPESGGALTERAKLLLIQRARIAKKASGKIPLAVSVLQEHFQEGQRWLVYCEDLAQLRATRESLARVGLPAAEYFSGMPGDPRGTLTWLQRFGGIVVSVRCLDEGVNIPEVSHALILASSQNPRQFIQRRGRVLRKASDKYLATVHDALVVPPHVSLAPDQVTLVGTELSRALTFARGALNREAQASIRHIAAAIGADPETDMSGFEEDDEEQS